MSKNTEKICDDQKKLFYKIDMNDQKTQNRYDDNTQKR